AVNLILFRISNLQFRMEVIEPSPGVNKRDLEIFDSKDLLIRDRLLHAMEHEKLYAQSGLTIGDVAKHLGVQAYKLRSVINQMLQFNNFSHFLNKYRIGDAE